MRVVLSNASPRWGGVHTFTELLARGLQGRGHSVLLLGRAGSPLEERMRGAVPFAGVLGGLDLDPLSILRGGRAMRRHGAQVVMALTTKDVRQAGVAARLRRIPLVIRHLNDRPLPPGTRGRLLYGGALQVVNAEATRRTLLASAPWLEPAQVEVIYNGVESARWQAALPADLGLPSGATTVGYLGAFEPRKGLLTLAAAWREVAGEFPEACLVMVGKGSQEAELRGALLDVPGVRWLGYRGDAPAVMRALDLLVLPSFVEGAPNVVLEAMAAGKPVLATAVSGTPELFSDGVEGRLVPAGDVPALAGALRALLADPGARARMGAAGALRVRSHFSLDAMLDGYEGLLERMIAGRAR